MKRTILKAIVIFVLVTAVARAENLSIARVTTPPRIDGVLGQEWDGAAVASGFVQVEPAFGAGATVKTELYLMYDDANLYVAIRAEQPRAGIRASAFRRDSIEIRDGDWIGFAIDPQATGNAAYYFIVNPVNAVIDGVLDSAATWSRDWDSRFLSAVTVDGDGWSAEMAIPLKAIGWSGGTRPFGFLAIRHYAERQELLLNRIGDRNAVYRIDRFEKAGGSEQTAWHSGGSVVPYAFGSWRNTAVADASRDWKGGLDLRYQPAASMTVLATVDPDFAQIESDEQVINVDDVPTSYPEKRPFFTESSDLYQGLAVNTRNIGEIRAGAKLRQVLPTLRYDLTAVEDTSDTRWLLGDARWTDNRRYHVEVIGGLKDADAARDYNLTTNLRTWMFDHRLNAYTWFGTINGHEGRGNEWESVNSIRWDTRRVRIGVWNHFKSELYNPNIVGFDTLSNQVILKGWIGTSWFSDRGRFREVATDLNVERDDLYSERGHPSVKYDLSLKAVFRTSDSLGVWTVFGCYMPPTRQLFRYRSPDNLPGVETFTDAYGTFALVEQQRPVYHIDLTTDPSKVVSLVGGYEQAFLRGASEHEAWVDAKWKIRSNSTLGVMVDSIDVGRSEYQDPFRQTIARIRVEQTFARGINVRALFQSNAVDAETSSKVPTLNLVVSWPVDAATTVYFVVNDSRPDVPGVADFPGTSATRNVALKVSRALSF